MSDTKTRRERAREALFPNRWVAFLHGLLFGALLTLATHEWWSVAHQCEGLCF